MLLIAVVGSLVLAWLLVLSYQIHLLYKIIRSMSGSFVKTLAEQLSIKEIYEKREQWMQATTKDLTAVARGVTAIANSGHGMSKEEEERYRMRVREIESQRRAYESDEDDFLPIHGGAMPDHIKRREKINA